jgi:hypothetical protein
LRAPLAYTRGWPAIPSTETCALARGLAVKLTANRRDLLLDLFAGETADEIAARSGRSHYTIRNTLKHIRMQLGVTAPRIVDLMRLCLVRGIVTLDEVAERASVRGRDEGLQPSRAFPRLFSFAADSPSDVTRCIQLLGAADPSVALQRVLPLVEDDLPARAVELESSLDHAALRLFLENEVTPGGETMAATLRACRLEDNHGVCHPRFAKSARELGPT